MIVSRPGPGWSRNCFIDCARYASSCPARRGTWFCPRVVRQVAGAAQQSAAGAAPRRDFS